MKKILKRITLLALVVWLSLPAHAHWLVETQRAPAAWDGQMWLIMPLTIGDSRVYYEAYQSSARYLYQALGWSWPTRKISPAINLDMVRYQVDQHQQQESFTYVVRARGERDIVGAVYINPVNKERRYVPNFQSDDFKAEVTFWFTEEAEELAQANDMVREVLHWLEQEWPATPVLLPVNNNYKFIHQTLQHLEYEPFTEDKKNGEQLYRLR